MKLRYALAGRSARQRRDVRRLRLCGGPDRGHHPVARQSVLQGGSGRRGGQGQGARLRRHLPRSRRRRQQAVAADRHCDRARRARRSFSTTPAPTLRSRRSKGKGRRHSVLPDRSRDQRLRRRGGADRLQQLPGRAAWRAGIRQVDGREGQLSSNSSARNPTPTPASAPKAITTSSTTTRTSRWSRASRRIGTRPRPIRRWRRSSRPILRSRA